MPNKKFLLTILSYALIMLVFGPLMGVLHQESGKKVGFTHFSKEELNNIKVTSILEIAELKDVFKVDEKVTAELSTIPIKNQIKQIQSEPKTRELFLNYCRQNSATKSLISAKDTKPTPIEEFKEIKEYLRYFLKIPAKTELNDFELNLAKENLARLHGHAILIGAVIPILMCIVLWFTYQLGGAPITDRSLKIISTTYIISSIATISLMLIKGYSFNLGVRNGITDWEDLSNYLISSHGLKAALYGLTHTLTFFSLYYFVFKIFQSLNNREEITEEEILNKKRRMIIINGLLWVGIGVLLLTRGIKMFPETSSVTFYIALVFGLIIGGAKGIFVLGKTSKKNVTRIMNLQKPVQYTSTIPIMLILLIPIMIAFGLTLRHYKDSIPGKAYTVGAVYAGIGSALILASLNYWKSNIKKKDLK